MGGSTSSLSRSVFATVLGTALTAAGYVHMAAVIGCGYMADELKRGDHVEWSSHGVDVPGEVEKRITDDTEAAGRTVKASEDDPQFLVKSDKSGREAVHRPEALRKKKK